MATHYRRLEASPSRNAGRALGLSVSLLALMAAAPAWAQQAAAPVEQAEAELPPVRVGAESEFVGDPFDTPASVSAVSIEDIRTFSSGTRIDDVLRSIPGTFTRQSTSNPGVAVNIRGFEGSGRVNMMIDGVRQNFRFVGHEAAGFAYVDDALLAGIEIERGAVSTVGGAGALVGLANFRTLEVDDIIKDGKNWGAIGQVSWGSNGVGFKEMVAGAVRVDEKVGIAGAVSHRQPDSYKNGDGQTVPNTGEDLTSGLVKAQFDPNEDTQLKLGAVWYDNDFISNSYNQNVRVGTYTANFAWNPDSELIDFKLNTYYTDTTMTYGRMGSNGSIGSGTGRVIEDKGWGFDISNISRFMLGQVGVKANYGFEYFKDDVDAYNTYNPSVWGGVNPNGESSVGGAFLETTFTYSIVDFIVGLRYDFYTIDGSGEETAAGGAVPIGPWTVDQSEGKFDPKLTLALNPYDWLQVYGTYSQSFRPPTISETMVGGDHPGGGGNYSANPWLKPEEQEGWEFGANFRKDGLFAQGDKFRAKAAYYTMDVENYITACFGIQTYFCNVAGTSKVDGVELEANYDVGYFYVNAAYTYTHTDLPTQTPGFGASQYLPDNVFTLTAGARFLEEKLTVGGRLFVASDGKAAYFGAPDYTTRVVNTDGYYLIDVFGKYAFDNGLELALNVSNLLDEDYTPALSTVQSGSVPAFTGDTGQGRTVVLSLRGHF